METFLRWLNKALMFDLFLVFFFFAWFVVAVTAESLHVNLGWGLWQQLWQPLIQPALGIMMAGAIASGVITKIADATKNDRQLPGD
jgi:ABC-type microcin C transport system permease subunit YejB